MEIWFEISGLYYVLEFCVVTSSPCVISNPFSTFLTNFKRAMSTSPSFVFFFLFPSPRKSKILPRVYFVYYIIIFLQSNLKYVHSKFPLFIFFSFPNFSFCYYLHQRCLLTKAVALRCHHKLHRPLSLYVYQTPGSESD